MGVDKTLKALKTIGKIFLYFVIIIFIIILIGAGIIWGYQKYKHHQLAKELDALPMDESLSDESVFQDSMDEKLGDNEMTVEEKLELGLSPYKTDTSGNGLSDDEAVEKGLDPKKFSTADDGISDYVKIEEGLDPKEEIDPKDIEEFTIEDEDLGTTLKTDDLNAKYFSTVENYEQDELDEIYQPVRDPIRVHNYDGEMVVDMPDGEDKDISAYYFNLEEGEMEKVKKQKWINNAMELNIDKNDPIYFFDDDLLDDIGDYYYFRISPYIFGPGYDHKLFIFKQGLFTDDLFEEEKIDNDDYGVVEISKAEISYIYSLFLDGLFKLLDTIFQPLDGMDENIYTNIWLDYGKIEGTPDSVQYHVMPWLYEDNSEEDENELETENENSKKVIDTGFRPDQHAFLFGNMKTTVAPGGVCAGISRTTERVFNDQEIKSERTHESDKDDFDGLHYDITGNEDDYPFLKDGQLFDYTFTDGMISHLTEDEYMDGDLEIDAGMLSEPDQSLIQLLETQWGIANDKIFDNQPFHMHADPILDEVEEHLADGQIVLAAFTGNEAGHSVSIYKMEYDRYDDNLIRLYVYDPNLPYEKLTKEYDREEVYIEINKMENELIPNQGFFEYTYHPFEDLDSDYGYSDQNQNSMLLYHNDKPIDK